MLTFKLNSLLDATMKKVNKDPGQSNENCFTMVLVMNTYAEQKCVFFWRALLGIISQVDNIWVTIN